MSLTPIQADILRRFEAGETVKEIAVAINWKASSVRACIELYGRKPGLELGWKGMLKLAREAGLTT